MLLVVVLAACSSKPDVAPPERTDPKPVVKDQSLEELISSDAIGVFRQPGDQVFMVRYTRELIEKINGNGVPACWTQLEQRVTAGYQVAVAQDSYMVIEGNLPEAEITSCVTTASRGDIKFRKDGDLVEITTLVGVAHAAWRGRYVVVGSRDLVDRAVRTATRDTSTRWRELILAVASAPTWMLRTDHSVDHIVGGKTTSVAFIMDQAKPPPTAFFAGRFRMHYATPANAETGERFLKSWIERGEFPVRVPDQPAAMKLLDDLAVGLQKTKITRTGTKVELAFDSDMFGGAENLANILGAVKL
jgi:hypothetical protein